MQALRGKKNQEVWAKIIFKQQNFPTFKQNEKNK